MAPGEERLVPVRLEGAPPLVSALSTVDRVLVRRAADELGEAGAAPRPPDGVGPFTEEER
jgi:hypothetical protein